MGTLVCNKLSEGQPILTELKNGETYNGTLFACDNWMNLHLKSVILSTKDGSRFFRITEAYIRGNTIKYLRVAEPVLAQVQLRVSLLLNLSFLFGLCMSHAEAGSMFKPKK